MSRKRKTASTTRSLTAVTTTGLLAAIALVAVACEGGSDTDVSTGAGGSPGSSDDGGVGGSESGASGGTSGGTSGSGGTSETGGGVGEAGSGSAAGTTGTDSGASGTAGSGGSSTPCIDDASCAATPGTPYCGANGTCVACEQGDPDHVCLGGPTCCGTQCVNTDDDEENCGSCGTACDLMHAFSSCAVGQCMIDACEAGWTDCDLTAANGCEVPQGDCACPPGETEPCYTGPAGTQDVSVCKGGIRTCNAQGNGWSSCEGQVTPTLDDCLDSIDNDCDGVVNNGYPNGQACLCIPGTVRSCYTGPSGTEGVGTCVAGTQTCIVEGTGYTLCENEVKPRPEVCGNGLDEDCDGTPDDTYDLDGDGWTTCDGDCCDEVGAACADPALVNPGAAEYPGNNVDDDCNPATPDTPVTCDDGLPSNSSNPLDYAKAIDLCQEAQENAPLAERRWGVIDAKLVLADGTASPANVSRSIRSGFGTSITPHLGSSLAVLSTGNAADSNDSNPSFAAFQEGEDTGTTSGVPADWLAANGGNLPNAPGCPQAQDGIANNPVMLQIRVRVPTNARSFSVDSYFFSAEYPEWVCSPYNDFFVALLDSGFNGSPANPSDKNLAYYDPPPAGAPHYPVGVNLAFGDTGLFRQCVNGQTGCADSNLGSTTSCLDTNELVGTGFDTAISPSDPYSCGTNDLLGGGTGWLITRGNVVPGEIITLRFAIWDTGDAIYDSVVLLDHFQWSVTPSQPGTGE
jgi:hypothetical protein